MPAARAFWAGRKAHQRARMRVRRGYRGCRGCRRVQAEKAASGACGAAREAARGAQGAASGAQEAAAPRVLFVSHSESTRATERPARTLNALCALYKYGVRCHLHKNAHLCVTVR